MDGLAGTYVVEHAVQGEQTQVLEGTGTPARTISSGLQPRSSRSPITNRPPDAVYRPVSRLMVVVLPEPLGPIGPKISPG